MPVEDIDKHGALNKISNYINKRINTNKIETNTILPAVVNAYNPLNNTVEIETTFKISLSNGQQLEVPPLKDVPLARFGGGDFKIIQNPSKGDNGLALICQRSIDEWKESISLGVRPKQITPKNKRSHDINDAVFIPLDFSRNPSDGIKYSGSIDFKNDFTSLKSLINDLISSIESLQASLNIMNQAIPLGLSAIVPTFGTPGVAGAGIYTSNTTPIFGPNTVQITRNLLEAKLKINSLLK